MPDSRLRNSCLIGTASANLSQAAAKVWQNATKCKDRWAYSLIPVAAIKPLAMLLYFPIGLCNWKMQQLFALQIPLSPIPVPGIVI
jgi:hypothetical protein